MAILYKNVNIYLGRYPFKAKTSKFALDYSVEEKDPTTLADNTSIVFPGLMQVKGSMEGNMALGAAASGEPEPLISERVGSLVDFPIIVSRGGASGDRAFFYRAFQVSGNPIEGGVGDLHRFTFSHPLSASRLAAGRIMLPEGSISAATGSGTAYQLGTLSATQKLYAAVCFLDVSAGGSVVLTVESDNAGGFPSATTRATFTAATGATEEWKEVAGAITDDYWRITWARTGGATFNAVVAFGIGPA